MLLTELNEEDEGIGERERESIRVMSVFCFSNLFSPFEWELLVVTLTSLSQE